MKIGTVKFSKEFVTPIGLKEWIGIELEYDMSDECPKEVLTNAKTIVEQWHLEQSQQIGYIPQSSALPIIETKSEDIQIGLTPEVILSSPDLKILETYRWLIKGKPELERAHILRHDQLTQKQSSWNKEVKQRVYTPKSK